MRTFKSIVAASLFFASASAMAEDAAAKYLYKHSDDAPVETTQQIKKAAAHNVKTINSGERKAVKLDGHQDPGYGTSAGPGDV